MMIQAYRYYPYRLEKYGGKLLQIHREEP